MTNERTKGWIGTLAIHGLFAGALVLFSGLHSPDIEAPPVGSLVLNLTGDGSPLGVGGGNSPVPQGNPDASPAAPAEAPLFDPSTISKHIEKIKREQERVQAQPPVQPTAPVPPPKPKPDRPTRPPVPSPTGEHTTLSEFLAKNPTKTTTRPAKNPTTRPTTGKGQGKVAGVNVNNILGTGTGPIGVPNGIGLGGSPGGGGPIVANYRDRLRLLLQAQWQELLTREGGSLQSNVSGEFRLNISNNGNISFGGWIRNPNNALFESLLRRAIDGVGNVGGPRPPGMATAISFPISANLQ